ncbi:MAG: SpoIIE family protein phosphatase [Phycisphaerales bacterium]|nr:SpoIIE family protein phosphatase [Phycisphaerales bacterium]
MRHRPDRPTLLLASSSAQPGAHPLWVERVICGWGEPRPIVRRVTLEMINDRAFEFPDQALLVVWASACEHGSTLCRALDRASSRCMPTLVLSGKPQELARLAPPGVLVRDRASDPGAVGVLLRTLHDRQSVVDELLAEQNQMLQAQAGVRAQMEQMQEELTLASQIQQELIPRKAPVIEGLDLAVICRPAGFVSGDLFRVERLDEDRVGFFVADAVGHGVPAALFTLLIARSVRPLDADGHVIAPAQVLEALNRDMVERNVSGSRFATAVYGVMNVHTGACDVAGAGHPPPIVARPERLERVETSGPLLGIFEEARFEQKRITLRPHDALIVFTDGFENAFPSAGSDALSLRMPTTDHINRLGALGRACCESGQFERSVEDFERTLDQQLGSLHQPDDLTALVLAPAPRRAARREAA